MSKLLKLRRGTTAEHSTFVGSEGEVTVDTTKDTLVIHDNATPGGKPLATEAALGALAATVDSLGALADKNTVGTADINDASVTSAKIVDGAVGANKLASGAAVSNIGFTPVRQGGGTGQGTNAVYIGWNNLDRLLLQIDNVNQGYNWPVNSLNGAQAWVNFNGTGTVSIRAAHNVSSITDNGVGDYTANFITWMPDANYAISLAYSNEINGQHTLGFVQGMGVNGVRVHHYNAANSNQTADKSLVMISVFR